MSGQRPTPGPSPDLAAEIAALDVDVLGLNEVDVNWPRSGYMHQPQVAAEAMGAVDWRFAPSFRGPDDDRHSVRNLLADKDMRLVGPHYGIALLSRIPVLRWHRMELGKSPMGFFLLHARQGVRRWRYVPDEAHVAIAAELDNGWTIIGTHLSFMMPTATRQLVRVRTWARRFQPRVAIMGDMNLARWIIPLRPDWRSAVNASTYPSWHPMVQFDHILLPRDVSSTRIALPQSAMSDHRAIGADVR